jgi:predicted metal-dependent hydrolase
MKTVIIPDIGEVQVVKHAQARSLRMSIRPDGTVRVTIPKWTPYQAGVVFAQSKKDWIAEHLQPVTQLQNGMAIGKFHHLYFQASASNKTISTRQKGSELWVTYPDTYTQTSPAVQKAATKIAIRALRDQAEKLLPQRLRTLADKHDFIFTSVQVRQLKARWGSCNHKQEITLNLFLMQLPWDLIDYVLLHELTHTKALHHGPEFWQIFESALPGAKQQRKRLHDYKPNF